MVYVFKKAYSDEVLAVVNTESDDMLIKNGYNVSAYKGTEPVFGENEYGEIISPENMFMLRDY